MNYRGVNMSVPQESIDEGWKVAQNKKKERKTATVPQPQSQDSCSGVKNKSAKKLGSNYSTTPREED